MAVNPDFSDLFKTFNACAVEYLVVGAHAVTIHILGRDDLIRSKRAVGRPQDLLDADELERS